MIRTSRHSQIVNEQIRNGESAGMYSYLSLHIEGTMDSFSDPIRILRVRCSAGKNLALALGSGKWIEYVIGRDRIAVRP
jgi:hypothetical protein